MIGISKLLIFVFVFFLNHQPCVWICSLGERICIVKRTSSIVKTGIVAVATKFSREVGRKAGVESYENQERLVVHE